MQRSPTTASPAKVVPLSGAQRPNEQNESIAGVLRAALAVLEKMG